jgi:hypothetical protein
MPGPWRWTPSNRTGITLGVLLLLGASQGCGGTSGKAEPDAKVRITKVLRLYQAFVEKNKKGPPDESALLEFGRKLSAQQRDEYMIGEDLDSIFTSPRDNQKYMIQYGIKLDPGGATRAIAWEAVGQDGKRWVALSRGYVEEYNEETFQRYRK